MEHPALLERASASVMNGSADAYLVEGSDLSQFDYDNQSWVIEGGVIDLDGKSAELRLGCRRRLLILP